MADRIQDLGVFTAYGEAREAGYEGSKAEFELGLKKSAEYAENAQASAEAAAASADDAELSAAGAAESAEDAETSAGEATQSATDAAASAVAAAGSANAASASATQAASNAQAALGDIAPVFDATKAYNIGDYVIYTDGKLYRFTADHAAGAWVGTDAIVAVIGDEISELKSAVFEAGSISWENGWINTSTGEPSPATPNRIRSQKFMLRKGASMTITPGGMYWNFGKYTRNGAFSIYSGSWKTTNTDQTFVFDEDLYIVVGLRLSSDANITPGDVTATVAYQADGIDVLREDVTALDAKIDTEIEAVEDSVDQHIQQINSILDDVTEPVVGVNICDPNAFEPGYISYTTGNVGGATGTSYKHTDYLPISLGSVYALYGFSDNYLSKYKTDKSYLTTSDISVATALGTTDINGWKVFTADWNGYLRLTLPYNYTNTPMLVTASEAWVQANDPSTYIQYGGASGYAPKGSQEMRADITALQNNSQLHVYLPPHIYCAVGRTIEIYNDQVCLEAEKYYIQWECKTGNTYIGKALKRKFSVEGTNDLIGTYTLTCNIYDDAMKVLWTGSSTLHIVAALALSETYSICPIGDSLTNQKRWEPEVIKLSDEKIAFVGTFSANTQDSAGAWRAYNHEGRSGFSSTQYINGNSYSGDTGLSHNKFWDGTEFSWEHYVTTYSIAPDAVMIWLGVNGLQLDNTANAGNIIKMYESIRDYDAEIPVYLCNTMYRGNQNGLGVQQSNDGYAFNKGAWNYQEKRKIFDLMTRLDALAAAKNDANLHMVNLALCFDSEYNYGAEETPVNPRAAQTELMPTEATHPQPQGYFQIADIMFSVFSAFVS